MVGETLGHYRVLRKLDGGGQGEVYLARDSGLDREVALKVLPAGLLTDAVARKRFQKEAHTLSRLNHPNIATVFEFGEHNNIDFLAMEYVEGVKLSEKLAAGEVPELQVLALGIQIAEALEEAHEHGVIHGDLKPANIMVTPKGRVKVLDFGLAQWIRTQDFASSTRSSFEIHPGGTLPYMAPELLRSEAMDQRTDIYAAAVVLYEMAGGKRPFLQATAPQLIDAILHHRPAPLRPANAPLSFELGAMILKCLEKNPASRLQSAKDLRLALEVMRDKLLPKERPPAVLEGLLQQAIVLDACVIRPGQLLSPEQCRAFEGLMKRRLNDGYRLFVLDMADTPSVNSLSSAKIVSSMTVIRMRMGKFVLAGISKGIQQWLEVTRLGVVFETFATVESALAQLLDRPVHSLPRLEYEVVSASPPESPLKLPGPSPCRLARFSVFEVDLQAGELRKQGMKIKLQEKPFQVLCLLLERPGMVVTREEIQKRLWPDTIVEFEHNLNAAVQRLRDALDDSADTPRFIETLPRRGYRFIAAVQNAGALPL
jgi:serine/threonine protein kinase/DNA-binding winged helix-turn-helix (wHTH) protein